jgi:hypothetical protein
MLHERSFLVNCGTFGSSGDADDGNRKVLVQVLTEARNSGLCTKVFCKYLQFLLVDFEDICVAEQRFDYIEGIVRWSEVGIEDP